MTLYIQYNYMFLDSMSVLSSEVQQPHYRPEQALRVPGG
jgi:hypothetical protein